MVMNLVKAVIVRYFALLQARLVTDDCPAWRHGFLTSHCLFRGTIQWPQVPVLQGQAEEILPAAREPTHLYVRRPHRCTFLAVAYSAHRAWSNAMAFTCPVAFFAITCQQDLKRTCTFSPLTILAYTFLYMVMHDVYFYMIHSTFHYKRLLYNWFHAMHHEYVYAMNVYCVGYAEVAENFFQVGVPWVAWTWIAGGNWFNWILPLSLVLFTTLIGHSGYRMSPLIAVFHPLVIPVVALTGKHMLTPGDHQVHHTHRRYNYGLFWRGMDKYYGTYRKCDVKAHDVTFWKKWHEKQQFDSEEGKRWLGRHNTKFTEVEWGF